jgi:hypothetical protein
MNKEIEIIIPADGSDIKVDLKGYEGVGCSSEIEELLKELDGKSVLSNRKPEYYKKTIKNKNTLKK